MRRTHQRANMTSPLAHHTWETIQAIHAAQRQEGRIQQQTLVRLFEALEQQDDAVLKKVVDLGLAMDTPLVRDGEQSHPSAGRLFPEGYPWSTMTPMGWAAWHGDVDVMSRLISLGADPWLPAAGGRDALWLVTLGGHPGALEFLMGQVPAETGGSFWNARSSGGKRHTRLMEAVMARNVDAVAGILGQRGLDLAAVDKDGRTALHLNFLQSPYSPEDQQIGQMLIDYGAPAGAEDHDGVSVAALAETPEQNTLISRAKLQAVAEDARKKAAAQRAELDAMRQGQVPMQTDEADFEQIKRPVIFKKPRF